LIGAYWMLRPLKDSVFMSVVGPNYIPQAKFLSMLVVFPLVIIYSRLVDAFPRHRMMYVLGAIYGVLALCFAVVISLPGIGMANMVLSPYRFWAWGWYVYVESFGSLIVALFWAFVSDITNPESARRGFPVIAFGGQIGNMLCPLILVFLMGFAGIKVGPEGSLTPGAAHATALVHSVAVLLVAFALLIIMLLVRYFMKSTPKSQMVGFQATNAAQVEKEEHGAGFFEGIILLVKSPYLLAIFAIITAFEVIITILDFNFKAMVGDSFAVASDITSYLSWYASSVGLVSMLSIVLGINRIQKWLGTGFSLALLPVIITGAVLSFYMHPVLGMLFWIMVFSKAINYAFTQPIIKQLYIPTSTQAKYKSQAFIEMYGSRGSKALGSTVNTYRGAMIRSMGAIDGLTWFIAMCTYVSLGIIAVWFLIALYLGNSYRKAIDEKRVII